MLASPLGKPDHCERLPAALCMPNHAAFTLTNTFLRRADTEVLIVTAGLFRAGVEDGEVVDQFEESRFATELAQFAQQGILAGHWVRFALFPAQPVLLLCIDHAVTQALSVVAGHH